MYIYTATSIYTVRYNIYTAPYNIYTATSIYTAALLNTNVSVYQVIEVERERGRKRER